MHVLRIQHAVSDFDSWKQVFDSDPLGREKSGVRRHQVTRATDDPNLVMIDLEFDDLAAASEMQTALQGLWGRIAGDGLISGPSAQILETVETKDY